MIKICKTCKRETEVPFDKTANLRCPHCNSPECSFEQDVIIVCYYCKKKIDVISGRYINVINKCYQSNGMVQKSLWTVYKIDQGEQEKPILYQINNIRDELSKKPIKRAESKKRNRGGRPKGAKNKPHAK